MSILLQSKRFKGSVWRWACGGIWLFGEGPSIPIHRNPSTTAVEIAKCLSGPGKNCWKEEDIIFEFSQGVPRKASRRFCRQVPCTTELVELVTYKHLEALPVSNGILSLDVAVALTYKEQAGCEGNRLLSQGLTSRMTRRTKWMGSRGNSLLSQGLTSRMTRMARQMTSKQCGRRQEAERVRGWIPAPLEVSAGSLASQARIGLLTIRIGAEGLTLGMANHFSFRENLVVVWEDYLISFYIVPSREG